MTEQFGPGEGQSDECRSAPRGLYRDGMVVRRSGGCHPALGQARDPQLLHALRGKAQKLCGKIPLPAGRELRGAAGRCRDRGDHQHHAERRASGDDLRGRSRRQARLSGQADRQQHLGRPRHHRGLPQGRRGAGARLSAAAREPFPLCQAADRRRPVRQARQRRGQHQPRPPRQGRSHLLALPGRGHAGRRDAADRNPLYRRARLPDRADPCGARAVGATGAARRQS